MKSSIRYVGDLKGFMTTELAEAMRAVKLADAATETWKSESAAVDAAMNSNPTDASYDSYMKGFMNAPQAGAKESLGAEDAKKKLKDDIVAKQIAIGKA